MPPAVPAGCAVPSARPDTHTSGTATTQLEGHSAGRAADLPLVVSGVDLSGDDGDDACCLTPSCGSSCVPSTPPSDCVALDGGPCLGADLPLSLAACQMASPHGTPQQGTADTPRAPLLPEAELPDAAEQPASPPASQSDAGGARLLASLACLMFSFHCGEALVKESLFRFEGFVFIEALSALQGMAVAAAALADGAAAVRRSTPQRSRRPSLMPTSGCPLWVYLLCGCMVGISQLLVNRSLLHLDYVTQVICSSSKLLWVMAARRILLPWKSQPGLLEWVGGVAIVAGLCILILSTAGKGASALATDAAPGPNPTEGYICMALALLCDALLFVIEEGVAFDTYGASKQEVILCMQMLAALPSLACIAVSPSVAPAVSFLLENPMFVVFALVGAICNYFGVKTVLHVTESFNGGTAALLMCFRKVVTILLSLALYPKAVTPGFLAGGGLILAGANCTLFKRSRDQKEAQAGDGGKAKLE